LVPHSLNHSVESLITFAKLTSREEIVKIWLPYEIDALESDKLINFYDKYDEYRLNDIDETWKCGELLSNEREHGKNRGKCLVFLYDAREESKFTECKSGFYTIDCESKTPETICGAKSTLLEKPNNDTKIYDESDGLADETILSNSQGFYVQISK
jgi:hypothetical protein